MNKRSRNKGENIELLSIHIPKTAGTSFRKTLSEIYGEAAILRVDLPPKNQRDKEDPFAKIPAKINPEVRVLHGHFNPTELRQAYPGIPDGTKMITWVRDPVKRVISNYYYLRDRIREALELHPTLKVGLTNRMLKTLMEYAIQDVARDRMTKFIHGTDLSEFLFIGVQENYTADLQRLAGLLEWENYSEHYFNTSENKYSQVDKKLIMEIRNLNSLDWKIYQQAILLGGATVPEGL